MIITALFNENNGCDYHRILLPTQNMDLSGGNVIKTVPHQHIRRFEHTLECDILLYSRVVHMDIEELKKLKEKYGFKIVVDYDDSYELYYSHISYEAWKHFNVGERMVESCKLADAVLVSNEQVYNKYKDFNKNIHILPNALPIGKEPFKLKKVESDKIRFMYVAGSTHYKDLKSISNLFKKLNSDNEFKKKGNFVLCGYDNTTDKKNVWDYMEGMAKSCGSYERRTTLPLQTYIEHYNHGDISIAPLEAHDFNYHKSNLKFVEAGCMKHPFICSNILPYTVDKTKGIIFCNKTSEWYDAFKFFLKNPSTIEEFGNSNYEYVKQNYNLENINKNRLEIFKSLV